MDRRMALGIGNGVAAGALWGTVFLAPQLLPGFTAGQLAASRYAIYGALALALLAARRRPLPALGARGWAALAGLSLLGNLGYYVLVATAVQRAGGPATSLIVGMLPVTVALAGAGAPGAVPLRRLAGPLALCALGVGLIGHDAAGAGATWGLAYAGAALLSWTAYAVLNARWLDRHPAVSAHDGNLLQGLVTGALALGLAACVFPGAAPHAPADWGRFLAVTAGVALCASIGGNGFWNQASRLLPLGLLGSMVAFETLFALLYSFVLAWRGPTAWEAAAVVCLLAGVGGCAAAHRRPVVTAP